MDIGNDASSSMVAAQVPIIGTMRYERPGQRLREIPPDRCVRPYKPHDLRGNRLGRMLITWNVCHQLRGYVCLACDRETPQYASWCVGPAPIPLLPGEPAALGVQPPPPACGHPVLDAHPHEPADAETR
ncbi:hypothetical protein [Lentzea guizhouensis]|uniref:hypothetical protein n=1 Tax=Lentzea guizhouensis TaxID=1586287 RepID=UPI0012B6AB42|nr:hypothetical protein [Lentzea guizhouensis]